MDKKHLSALTPPRAFLWPLPGLLLFILHLFCSCTLSHPTVLRRFLLLLQSLVIFSWKSDAGKYQFSQEIETGINKSEHRSPCLTEFSLFHLIHYPEILSPLKWRLLHPPHWLLCVWQQSRTGGFFCGRKIAVTIWNRSSGATGQSI